MSAQVYRRHAAACLKFSKTANDPEARAWLMRMAIAWNDLADRADTNQTNEMTHEPRLASVQPPQQQQQPQKEEKE
jgi:hypothetical protein